MSKTQEQFLEEIKMMTPTVCLKVKSTPRRKTLKQLVSG